MSKQLKVGDVFLLEQGMKCYVSMPERFIYQNTPNSGKLSETNITIGEVRTVKSPSKSSYVSKIVQKIYESSDFRGLVIDRHILEKAVKLPKYANSEWKSNKLIGEYVVVQTGSTGGGRAGQYDTYPDGWKVTARRLNRKGVWNDTGTKISFYMSGCFNAMNTDVKVIRKMKPKF